MSPCHGDDTSSNLVGSAIYSCAHVAKLVDAPL